MRLDHLLSKESEVFVLCYVFNNSIWGFSSVGRAPALHAGGQEFESLYLHWFKKLNQREFFENYTVKENGSFSEIKQKKSRVFCI